MTPQIRCIIDIKIRPRRLLIDPIFHWGGQWTITITNIKQKYNFEIIFLPLSSYLNSYASKFGKSVLPNLNNKSKLALDSVIDVSKINSPSESTELSGD